MPSDLVGGGGRAGALDELLLGDTGPRRIGTHSEAANVFAVPVAGERCTTWPITAPEPGLFAASANTRVAISPDGNRIVFRVPKSFAALLFMRDLNSSESLVIPGTEGAVNPFFSPDGQWVGFFSPGKLQKISVEGGSAITLCDASS